MGTRERKIREKELRKLQILAAAKREFSDKGLDRATMADIAKKAELSATTLYLYFKNKNELYASLALRILQYLIIRLEQLHSEYDMDEVGKINNLKSALLDVYEFDPLILRCLFLIHTNDIFKDLSPETADEISELGGQAMDLIADIFREAAKKGVCIDMHPSAIADIVWSLFSGTVMHEYSKHAVKDRPKHLNKTLEKAFTVFENGISNNHQCAAAPGKCKSGTNKSGLTLRAG